MDNSLNLLAYCNALLDRRVSLMDDQQALQHMQADFKAGSTELKEALFASVLAAYLVAHRQLALQR